MHSSWGRPGSSPARPSARVGQTRDWPEWTRNGSGDVSGVEIRRRDVLVNVPKAVLKHDVYPALGCTEPQPVSGATRSALQTQLAGRFDDLARDRERHCALAEADGILLQFTPQARREHGAEHTPGPESAGASGDPVVGGGGVDRRQEGPRRSARGRASGGPDCGWPGKGSRSQPCQTHRRQTEEEGEPGHIGHGGQEDARCQCRIEPEGPQPQWDHDP